MNRFTSLLNTIIFLALFTISCEQAEEVPRGEFAEGVIIVNEGNFSDANGSISFYNETTTETTQDIFEKANDVTVGGLIQSIYFFEDRAFIIDNLGSKIYVVNAETFELITTIEDNLSAPRYMLVKDGLAYISNWGPYDENFNLTESYVSVINLNTYEQMSAIATEGGCEGMIAFGDKVFVANSFSNTVGVIDTNSGSISSQIEVVTGPRTFVEDANGKYWLLTENYLVGSSLYQIDPSSEQVLKSFIIGTAAKSLNVSNSGDNLYYLTAPFGSDANVNQISIEATEDNSVAVVTSPNLYGLGIHPATGEIFVGNHNGFQGNGTVLIYDGGELLSTFASGVGPNGFVFR